MYWLAIGVLITATIVFILCYRRLRENRFLHKIYLHSFDLLSVTYVLMYTECVFGIFLSCIIFYGNVLLKLRELYMIIFVVAATTSMNFIARILRQYRIYVSTYIETGRVSYEHILKRKKRLRKSWNIIIACSYTGCIMITNFFVLAAPQHIQFEEMYTFLTKFLAIEKVIELFVEICCFFFS